MKEKTNKYLIVALIIGLVFHGSAVFFTIENTYDALIHLFFAEHYANSWFEPWNYKWYTGFTVMGYPPLVHQAIGLLSLIGGLKFGMFTVAIIAVILFITGVYRFSLLITASRKAAGYAALLAVFSSTFVETLHIFGQLPSIIGISILMHSLPEIYLWIKTGRYKYLWRALSLIAVTVTSHHVTPIFGMVFFIFPLIGMVIMDYSKEQVGSFKKIKFRLFLTSFFKLFKRIILFGGGSLFIIVFCILPYWINSKKNPITQVPIPHGSRDNFLEVTSSGLVFFLIPWGILLFLLPYIFYRYYAKRYLCFGLSITLLTVLGTGGTTPIPKMMLGETAFNILTLDRFTLWASIMSLPIFGEFAYRFAEGDLRDYIQEKYGAIYHRVLGAFLVGMFLLMTVFTITISYFRPMQPQKIKMLPIVNFLNQDQHDHWRFLTLGFGDQMAWLSAQTGALTVDGNYHSARRLPELTTRAVERLENSKFRGVEGIGSLQQFLTVPEKYNLKYIFSNDKFYDPLLYFCGWQRLQQLENGIMVWEKLNVPPLSKILPKEDVPIFLKLMWGIIPMLTVILAFIINMQVIWYQTLKIKKVERPDFLKFENNYNHFNRKLFKPNHLWALLMLGVVFYGVYLFYVKNTTQLTGKNVVEAYYDALDFKEFERAHSYLDPDADITIAQYMLEVSVTDGILSSYAKLNSIEVELLNKTKNHAKAIAKTTWVTPLERIDKTYYHELVKKQGKWYLEPNDFDLDIPPDQLFSDNMTQFYNHGRRRVTTQQTHHEDVLKQPVLEILSAKLVCNNSQYSIIGELQNVDNVPSDVVLKATLYNDDNEELANYNAKYMMKHKLMPKEVTSFRIDFEGIAWMDTATTIPETFNPDEFTPVELDDIPTKFNLQSAGNVATSDLYKQVSLSAIEMHENSMEGTLFNYGIQEVTIPQLLVSYYDKDKKLIWVASQFMREGVRIQRKQYFAYEWENLIDVEVLNSSLENCYVNGLPNESIAKKVIPNRKESHHQENLQAVKAKDFSYIKVELNSYIGNPH
ncbi:hypothetical protein [Mesonia oceanica]|uniref:Uncharacterized protein n=1 Tax=Mesonia oceanica TaxID=2687242 RepID=A0AC61Y523_9FLAO|nr:hypothetical protein [Mesonia oceanica]MAQ39675.1 hypothetical protein [Mesonia sp.]VVU99564.1 hypothetical protein FVB9532_00819 [Mesonia oceanica]